MARVIVTLRNSDKSYQIHRLWERTHIAIYSSPPSVGWYHGKQVLQPHHPSLEDRAEHSHHQQEDCRLDLRASSFQCLREVDVESRFRIWRCCNDVQSESAPAKTGCVEMYRRTSRHGDNFATDLRFKTHRWEYLEVPFLSEESCTSFRFSKPGVFRFDTRVVQYTIQGRFSRSLHIVRGPVRIESKDHHNVPNLSQCLSQCPQRNSSEAKSEENRLKRDEDLRNRERDGNRGLHTYREIRVDTVVASPQMGLSRLAKKIRFILGGGGRSWEALAGLGINLNPSLVSKVLKVVEDFRLAYGFFKWAGEQQGYENTADVYNVMVGKLAANRHAEGAVQLLQEMTAKGLKVNIVTYTNVIHASCKAGDINTALKLFTEMRASECAPNVFTFNALVNGLGKVGRVNEALELFEEMKVKGCPPDVVTFNTLIDTLGRSGKLDLAVQLLEEMESTGCTPDVVTYNSLIYGFGKEGKGSAACSIFHVMKGNGCEPDTVTYNTLMGALAKAQMWDQAFELLDEFHESQSKPEAALYTCLIDALCKAKLWRQAFQVFENMQQHGCKPDVFTYTTLVIGIAKSGEWDKAWALVEDMKKAGFTPNVVTYNSLIDSLGKAGQDEAAWRLFLEMEQSGVSPDAVTYNSLITGLGKVGRLEEALDLLETMKTRRLTPTIVTYTSLVDLQIKAGSIKVVWELLERMNLQGLKPNAVTYRVLIDGFCKAGELELAWDFFLSMLDAGYTPHLFTYKSLIIACHKAGMVDKMLELFEIIRQSSYGRSSGQLRTLEDFLKDLKQASGGHPLLEGNLSQ